MPERKPYEPPAVVESKPLKPYEPPAIEESGHFDRLVLSCLHHPPGGQDVCLPPGNASS